MSETHDDQFTTFKIAREIEKTPDLRRFHERVREIGRSSFTVESQASLPISVLSADEQADLLAEDEYGPPILSQVHVGVNRLVVYRNLELSLLERTVPRDMNYVGRFTWATGRLREKNTPVVSPVRQDESGTTIRTRTHNIHTELRRAQLPYDGRLDDEGRMEFTGIGWVLNPFRNYRELALLPDPESPAIMLWADQAELCFQALADLSKRVAYPAQHISPAASFARIPEDATFPETQHFVQEMKRILPITLEVSDTISMDVKHREMLTPIAKTRK